MEKKNVRSNVVEIDGLLRKRKKRRGVELSTMRDKLQEHFRGGNS